MFTKIVQKLRSIENRKLVIAGAFSIALISAAGLGFATKQFTQAAMARDCDDNAIMRCGADDVKEFIADAKANNGRTQTVQSDIQGIYAHYGLSTTEYSRFESTAQQGTVYKNGDVIVNGKTVLTGANSLGRQSFGKPSRKPTTINGKTYYYSSTQDAFANGVNSLPVMVMFDAKGAVEFIAMNACGNPVWGNKVTPEYSCKMLNQTTVANKANTYSYTTTVGTMKNATVNKLVYNFGDGTTKTVTNPAEAVEHTFTKSSEVSVTVYFNLPGNQVVAAEVIANCKKKVTVTPPAVPYYQCTAVTAAALNDKKTQFRFTVKTSQGNGATLKDADFTFDNNTTTGVTAKDANGNIYKDYTVAEDGKTHNLTVKVNFNVAGGVQSKTCEASVTAGKTPMCPVPGKEHLPADSDQCVENCPVAGKTHLPVGSPECKEDETPPTTTTPPAELPKTGAGSILGIFAGTTAFGAIAHGAYRNRRARKNQ